MQPNNPLLTIQIVGWNSEKHLTNAAKALAAIPADEVVIRYIDNGSSDNSVNVISSLLPHADIIRLAHNTGFARAHNIGFSACTTPYILTHDPDVVIEWPGIQKLLEIFNEDTVGSAQGLLLRTDASTTGKPVIDSAGIVQTMTLNGKERGAGEEYTNQYNTQEEILAATGACAMYRVSAMRDLTGNNGLLFDQDFFAYKEDVDTGWQLRRHGWKVIYHPVIAGHHARTLGAKSAQNWGTSLRSIIKRLKSPRTRYSLRNYVWMIIKNVTFKELLLHDLFITARLGAFLLLSCLYPPLFLVYVEILRGFPDMVRKRVT